MPLDHRQLMQSTAAGFRKGLSGYVWMLKIVLPISLATMLLEYSGLLRRLDFLLGPLMGLFNLPAEAAVPLLIGMLAGIYGGLASLSALSLTLPQATLVAVFLLIAHNLVQEGVIQGRSGWHPLTATVTRLAAAGLTVAVLARLLAVAPSSPAVAATAVATAGRAFSAVAMAWAADTALLCIKIFVIIMALMILLEILKSYRLLDRCVAALAPLLGVLGLRRRVGFLWLTAAVFGLSYSGAVIVEEARTGNIDKSDLTALHLSIGINHSIIEDPLLFLPLGISPLWLWLPRLLTAVVFVWLYNLRAPRPIGLPVADSHQPRSK